jgi:TPP-dependent indolepyruvate ferredoxin oxidoreductase alpha subunit
MDSPDFLQLLNKYRDGAPTVISAGQRSRQFLTMVGDDPLVMCSMDFPYATPICLGLAQASGLKRVVALDGDGNMVAGLCGLTTIARYQPENLVVVICDNESFGSFQTGSIHTATGTGVDLASVARSCGIVNACTVRDLDEADDALRRAFSEPGPWVIVAKVRNVGDTDSRFWTYQLDIVENGFGFKKALRSVLAAAESG